VVVDPAVPVGPQSDIELDGEILQEAPRHYLAFHKPLRVVFRPGDVGGQRLVKEYLPRDLPGLRPAGRLDGQTSGLVLVSNDADWNDRAAAARGLEREFRVEIAGGITDLELELIAAGMHLHNLGFVKPREITLVRRHDQRCVIGLVLAQGRTRQIRRIFSSLRHEVLALRRIRIAAVRLGDLPSGQLRPLTIAEIRSVRGRIARERGGSR
jgi:23S rRNA pseudouridine2605 synthase